jgi:hypothetical protein
MPGPELGGRASQRLATGRATTGRSYDSAGMLARPETGRRGAQASRMWLDCRQAMRCAEPLTEG